MRLTPHGFGARRDGLDDVVVAGAPADVAFELFPDGALVELVAEPIYHVDRRHYHAGCAETALQSVVLAECLLHRVQLIGSGKTLDGEDICSLSLQRQHGARFDGLAVDMDDAAAALRGIAAHVRSG